MGSLGCKTSHVWVLDRLQLSKRELHFKILMKVRENSRNCSSPWGWSRFFLMKLSIYHYLFFHIKWFFCFHTSHSPSKLNWTRKFPINIRSYLRQLLCDEERKSLQIDNNLENFANYTKYICHFLMHWIVSRSILTSHRILSAHISAHFAYALI